ncbi:hypothetical protein SAMN05421858_2527 [Haladaptatus litoreus]|uniref:Uncharacterized protein n=1 Tax=Haladaptatus litoreus TaxID=553468 RepID=A0A1N7BFH2_9EURY|nr:transporter [Haladaptatus litoreus]SIR50098.1 hypothetical protein SAMN05421858_2527 [Haladaptatus litoreus]
MNIEGETIRDIVVSVVSVGLFIAATVFVGTQYDSGGLTEQGALALVAVMVGFVFLMAGVGFWLANQH